MRCSGDYRVQLPGTHAAVPWDPFAVERDRYPGFLEIEYLAGVFRAYEALDPPPVTFVVTWNVDVVPVRGDDVIVVLLGDEWCRAPRYAADVRAVVRTYRDRPVLTLHPARPFRLNALDVVQFARAHLLGAPQRLDRFRQRVQGHPPAPTHLVPLGYAHQLDLPLVDLGDRDLDVFFVGSMQNLVPARWSLRRLLGTPKDVTRSRMLHYADAAARRRPDLNVVLETTGQFAGNVTQAAGAFDLAAADYSDKMMRTKIALVPRGTSLDTYRLFEALRYGCVTVTDRLPRRWYYDGAPVVEIGDWAELPGIVDELTGDPARMRQLHVQARAFWDRWCSEPAVGRFLFDRLCRTGSPPVSRDASQRVGVLSGAHPLSERR